MIYAFLSSLLVLLLGTANCAHRNDLALNPLLNEESHQTTITVTKSESLALNSAKSYRRQKVCRSKNGDPIACPY